MVVMISCGLLHLKGLGRLAGFFQLFNLRMVRQFGVVTLLHLKVWRVLHPYVYAESALAGTLQGRPVHTISRAVVLPCDVVDTLRILSATHYGLHWFRRSGRNGKIGRATGTHAGVDEQLAVIRYLISNLLPEGVLDDEGLAFSDTELSVHVADGHLGQLLALHAVSISDGYRYVVGNGRNGRKHHAERQKQY